jgi:hypothetical protein
MHYNTSWVSDLGSTTSWGWTTWLVDKAKCKWQAKLQNPRWIVVLYILTNIFLCDASIGSYVLVMIWLICVGSALMDSSASAQ